MYDPLKETSPGSHQPYPDSYWAQGITPPCDSPLTQDLDTDVVIIGAGYTGMSAAYHLRRNFNTRVTILEANQIGWGCSGRNAGFVLAGSGRLSLAQMDQKWGNQAANNIYAEFKASVDTVSRMISRGNIQCDRTDGGYLRLAHNTAFATKLMEQAELLKTRFNENVHYVSTTGIEQDYLKGVKNFGGIFYPDTYSLNPLKLALGYYQLAREQGAELYPHSPVIDWQREGNRHRLTTPSGSVVCDHVIMATNGYTPKGFHPLVEKRHFPVISSVIVTRPLNQQELEALGARPGLMAMDTRALKYYYRLLPDNRLLFGGRGAISGNVADDEVYKLELLNGLKTTLPALASVTVDHFWSGWVSVSFDDYPRIWHSAADNISYAMGYCGSGVAFATQAGKRLAQQLGGNGSLPALPYWQSPLPKFPFAPFRRVGLRAFYAWAKMTG